VAQDEFRLLLHEINKKQDRILVQQRELNKIVATASTQAVGTGEAIHVLAGKFEETIQRMDGVVDLAEDDSRKTGASQIRVTGKQEQLLDIQIQNAKLTRIQIIFVLVGLLVTGTFGVLGFLKWYVHT